MQLTAKRPLYIAGQVVNGDFETDEQHGRELIRKGYASEPKQEEPAKPKASKKKPTE